MRFTAALTKTFKENVRDWKVLIMVLVFAPFFVFLMYIFYGGEATTYNVGILDLDHGVQAQNLITKLVSYQGVQDKESFKLSYFDDTEDLKSEVRDKNIDLGIVIPADFSLKLTGQDSIDISVIQFYGSLSNLRYTVAAFIASDPIYKQAMNVADVSLPISIRENFLETKQPINEFEGYVPGLLSLAVLMILFSACASIVKENDNKTLIRLKLSDLGTFNFLASISIIQAIIASGALMGSYWVALALGYRPAGEFWPVLLVGILASFSMVAFSLVVASFLNTVFDVLTIGCFPFFILMFFSGSLFPLPQLDIATIGGHRLGVWDILPLTPTSDAFNQILNYGAGLDDVIFDIAMIVILTLVYSVIGLLLYRKRQFSKA